MWTDEDVDWTSYDLLLIRSVWDYFLRYEEWLAWVDRVSALAPVRNTPDVVRWNGEKGYLRELEEAGGVPVIPTEWLARGTEASLSEIVGERGWGRVAVKPTVGGGALGLLAVDAGDAAAGEEHLAALLREGDAMVQPFLPGIAEQGELSLIFVAGALSHSVRKRPRPGDIRVQPEHGGIVTPEQPSAEEIAMAERALACAPGGPPLYGRADLVPGLDGESLLIELELIEPRLFVAQDPEVAGRLADAVAGVVSAET